MTDPAVIERPAQHVVSPFLTAEARIPALPEHLQVVPDDGAAWTDWKYQVKAYRLLTRRQCAGSDRQHLDQRRAEMTYCAQDPAYWLTMYGVMFEPRGIADNRPGWYPWIPFASQVRIIRFIEHVMEQEEGGQGDGIIEKSREMGVSWVFCGYIAHQFLFADVFVAGVVSRNADAVDKTGASDTLFYKIKSLLGLLPQVPAPLQLPVWMRPKGMTDDHVTLRNITHPTRSCIIQGETTTTMTGVGGRATLRFNDEAARFDDFGEAWANQAAVTRHRFAVSSADTKSPAFQALASLGRDVIAGAAPNGPSSMRLDWDLHPYHTDEWFRNERNRFAHDPHFFEREYLINYHAGEGEHVYSRFLQTGLVKAPYDPYLGQLYVTIDPGVRDPTAIVWIQEDTTSRRYRIIDGFEGMGGEESDFYASVLVGVPISGVGGYDYGKYGRVLDLMEWTASIGRPVIYFGDPAGASRGAGGRKTYYDELREKTHELTQGRNIVHVRSVTKHTEEGKKDARSHLVRKNALSKLAPRLDFNATPGASAVLTALKESRYPERKEGRAYVSETLEPQHDRNSHYRTALEYFAVNIEVAEAVKSNPPGRAIRQSMGGKRR